jgi:hypothetical protein
MVSLKKRHMKRPIDEQASPQYIFLSKKSSPEVQETCAKKRVKGGGWLKSYEAVQMSVYGILGVHAFFPLQLERI